MSLVFVYALAAALSPSPHNITLWMHSEKNQIPFILGALIFDGLLIKVSEIITTQNQYFYLILSLGSLAYLFSIILSNKKVEKKNIKLSFKSGLLIQLINPFPWIFWLSIAPTIHLNYQSPVKLILFLTIIYGVKLTSYSFIKFINISESTSYFVFKYAMPILSIALITKQLATHI